jgi:diguanylate cyclase (GGDEF)-like protein
VIRSQHRQLERVGALRGRLIASILIAGLLPFFAAWWIANAYVSDQARTSADVRLSFSARSAAREATALLSETRARALELAKNGKLQRAARRRDRPALARLLGPGEAVYLPARGRGATIVPGVWVGRRSESAPAVRVGVTAAGRRLATVSVSAPDGQALLDRVKRTALAVTGDQLALTRGGVVVVGPVALRGARLGADGRLQSGGDAFRARSVALPGYDPPVRIVAAADGSVAGDDSGALRGRLTIAALISLLAIGLYAAALARPLLRSLNRVASVAEQAMLDPLTGTANRRGFERALEVELERSARRGHPCALVIVDLDDFKLVNDRHGHGVGDEALVMLAERLRDSVRSADTVARLGGEEFALLLPETPLSGALAVAERARTAFAASGMRLKGGGELTVTASFGAADFPASPDRTTLMRDADQALYTAKRLGKNRVVPVTRAVEAA